MATLQFVAIDLDDGDIIVPYSDDGYWWYY